MSLELEDLKTGQEHGRYSASQADRTELLMITERNIEKISISSRQEDVQRKIIQEPKLKQETNPEPKSKDCQEIPAKQKDSAQPEDRKTQISSPQEDD